VASYLESAALSGGVLAERALERLLTRMHAHVNLQVTALDRRVVALVALERLDARVLRRVLGQVDLLIEHGLADLAEERGIGALTLPLLLLVTSRCANFIKKKSILTFTLKIDPFQILEFLLEFLSSSLFTLPLR
jgi:hypothetical protein